LAQLRSRWARQQIDQLIAAGISTEADRVRYAQLLKTMRSVVK
jgi:hypothetical protein